MNIQQQYCLGMSAYNARRYADAVRHLTPLMFESRGPTALLSRYYAGQAHYHLAVELFGQRKFDEATHHFRAASQVNPQGGGFGRYLAACHLGSGRLDLAAGELETLLEREPNNSEIRIRLALTQWKQGGHIEALCTLRDGVRRQPDHAELHYQLGIMLASEYELAEAESLFERVIALDPSHAGAHERLAQCSSLAGRNERALGFLERAHQLDPANARIAWQLNLLAQSLMESASAPAVQWQVPTGACKFDQATLDRLAEAVLAEPDFVQAFLSLPASDVDQEVFSALADTLENALQKHPEFADLHFHCGAVYDRLGRSADAIQHAEQAVELNPRYVSALVMLAQLYGQTDRWSAGVERLEQAIRAGGDYPDVHYLIGELCRRGGEPGRARRAFERAVELNGDYQAAREALSALPA